MNTNLKPEYFKKLLSKEVTLVEEEDALNA